MALSDYDPKLLNFLYELTKLKKPMSYKKIAGNIKIEGKKISPKTVERWFLSLKGPYHYKEGKQHKKAHHKFDYFPTFFYEKLGLVPTYVIIEGPKMNALEKIKIQTFRDYGAWLFDVDVKKSVLLYGYLVPNESMKFFEASWEKAKKEGTIKNYKIYHTHKAFQIYSPWHKVVDKRGIFHPGRNDSQEIDEQIENFERYMNNLVEPNMMGEIKKNPFIVPVVFEYHFEYWSSQQAWEQIKKNLGKKAWEYILKKKKETDGIGIRKVQETIEDIYKLNIFHRMRVIYIPLELENNFHIYLNIKCKNKTQLLETVRKCAMNSLYLTAYPMKENEMFLLALVNHESLYNIFNILEEIKVERMLFLQNEKSLPLLTNEKIYKFDYFKLFNPASIKWNYSGVQ